MEESTQKKLEEWKVTMENARHFNDLLIRLRMLGLPMVITIAVAGIASMGLGNIMPLWKWTSPLIAWLLFVFGAGILAYYSWRQFYHNSRGRKRREQDERKQNPPLPFYKSEFYLWWSFVVLLLVFAIIVTVQLTLSHESLRLSNITLCPITPAVLGSAVVLLIALYIMDRFYYYKLLSGAVSRLAELEKSLRFGITAKTSQFIPRSESTRLVTLFYWIPASVVLASALIIMALTTK